MSCNDSTKYDDLLKRLTTLEEVAKNINTETVDTTIEENTLTEETISEEIETEEAETIVEEVAELEKSDEPKRDDYDCPVEFHKAYTAWITQKEAEAPITKAALEKLLGDFKKDILSSVKDVKIDDVTIGEAVKKSIPTKKTDPEKIDYTKWLKSATDVPANSVPMERKQV